MRTRLITLGGLIALGSACTVSVDRGQPVYAANTYEGEAYAAGPGAPVAAAPVETPSGFRLIQGGGFWYSVPAQWVDHPVGAPVVAAERDPNMLGGLYTNVNLVTESYAGDPQSYASANIASLQGMAAILGQRQASVGALPAIDVESVWGQAAPPYRTLQRFTAYNGVGYVLTCTGSHATFEQVRGLCDSILGTFVVQQ